MTWLLNRNVGTLSASGMYTAPFGIGPPQIVTITATDNANSTQSASVTVNLIHFNTRLSTSKAMKDVKRRLDPNWLLGRGTIFPYMIASGETL